VLIGAEIPLLSPVGCGLSAPCTDCLTVEY
jgi:hypothetical protein